MTQKHRRLGKIGLVLLLALLGSGFFIGVSAAQVPYIAVYFDSGLREMTLECPDLPPGAFTDTLYVAGHNFNAAISSVEYKITWPRMPIFMYDLPIGNSVATGTSPSGIKIDFDPALDVYGSRLLQRVFVMWDSQLCDCNSHDYLRIDSHPGSSSANFTRSSDGVVVDAVGMLSLICGMIPIEKTSWGKVKALYN